MKSGTTSLHSYLGSHSEIFMCPEKERQFFAKETVWSQGEDWYLGLFAGGERESVIGESSTVYSRIPYFSGVPEGIAKFNPETRRAYMEFFFLLTRSSANLEDIKDATYFNSDLSDGYVVNACL